MDFFPHQFTAPVEGFDFGKMVYTVIYLPEAMIAHLPLKEHPRLRVIGEVEGRHHEGAFVPSGGGRWHMTLGKKKLKAIGKGMGDDVHIAFRLDEQDAVRLPPELVELFHNEPDLKEDWEAQPVGKRRAMAYRVASAKRPDTKAKRVAAISEALMTGDIRTAFL